ncbi:MAG: adenylate/guanylate cyclase domain-containing protein [Alphaproteobacteria bacterium]|nr:adenylate/guanylate cyclase domain-containing protein [Alphaproteobacteria bacterium]
MNDAATLTAFLFTDIEGSSLKWLNHRAAMQKALAEHDRLLRTAIAAHEGEVFKTAGDAFFAAFKRPSDAANAAIAAQKALAAANFSAVDGLKVRMAVHCGTAEKREGDWFGPALNRCARLLVLGHGGQILLTAATAELLASEREVKEPSRLLGSHPLDDPMQPVAIHQLAVTGLPQDFPPLRASETRPTNLPRHLTPLIGRESELQTVKELITANRLVTLTGPGGVGKTRLAIQAGIELLPKFANGVWFVELAPISDPALVVSAVGAGLRLDLAGNRSQRDILTSHLESRELVIVLDNCEHLIDAVAELAEAVLIGAPRVHILASSQELIGLPGEQTMRVASLCVPDAPEPSAAEALRASAVTLFLQRVKAGDVAFVFDDRAAPIAANICRRLDGVPLAIEMAAARVPALGLAAVAHGLDDRFRLLIGGRRTAVPRQRTLHATLDWSHALLNEKDRTVFRRLALFVGGFSLEAAQAVAGDGILQKFDVVDCLSDLVAKSLVVADTSSIRARYRLLETARAYAIEKLGEAGETRSIAARHAEYVREFLETGVDDWFRMPTDDWRRRYAPELDNLRTALDWAFGADGNPNLGIALAGAGYDVWDASALYEERRQMIELAAARISATTPPSVEARCQFTLGNVLMFQAPQRAHVALERSIALYRAVGDNRGFARSLYIDAILLSQFLSDAEAAESQLRLVAPLIEQWGFAGDRAWHHTARAAVAARHARLSDALAEAETAVAIARAGGFLQVMNLAQLVVSLVLQQSGLLDEAIAALLQQRERLRSEPFGDMQRLFHVLQQIVDCLTRRSRHVEALAYLREEIEVERPSACWGLCSTILCGAPRWRADTRMRRACSAGHDTTSRPMRKRFLCRPRHRSAPNPKRFWGNTFRRA